MYHSIPAPRLGERRFVTGFTLVEVMTATFIALYTMLAATGAYVMFWAWWHETNPEIEAQRIARIAISKIVDGFPDDSTESYTIGATEYRMRNGVADSMITPAMPSAQSITYQLDGDAAASITRSFYLGVDPVSGLNVVYYQVSGSQPAKINSTLGITDLRFSNIVGGEASNNMVTVTATVDRDIVGTGAAPHHIHVAYSRLVSLQNVH